MREGLIFANARAKAKEYNLLSEERLYRMMESKTLDEAVRVLIESNYAGGMVVGGKDFYNLLIEEEKITTQFVREVAPKDVGFECFFLKNDYHNLKSLVKAKFGNISDISDLIMPDGNYTFSFLKEKLEANSFDFNKFMGGAVEKITLAYEQEVATPRLIDVEMDKAMFCEISSRLGKKSDKYVKEYFVLLIDTTNILTFVRTMRIKASYNFFENNFIEGGSLKDEFFSSCDMDLASLITKLSNTQYKEFAQSINDGDFANYETMQDNYLLKIFSVNKNDMFSVAPIVGYYLAKLNEIKVIRVVLVCIKNQVPAIEMRKRVRVLYA